VFRSVNDVTVTVSGYVKRFLKIHNLAFKDAQINFSDTKFV